MAYFLNLLTISVVTCSLVKNTAEDGAQVQQVDNAEQFALLCRIYNVAKNPPINHVDLQDPHKIVKVIDDLNASLVEQKGPNEMENMGNISDAQLKPTITHEAAVAQVILNQITQKAHTILEEIRGVNSTMDIENIQAEFSQVIFGEGMNESQFFDGVLNRVGGRAGACGSSGLKSKGNSSGKNLVVDFFCLCAMRTKDGEGIGNVCGVEVGSKGDKREKTDNHGWSDEAPLGSPSMWASIKKGCVRLMHQHPKSTEEGHEIINDFFEHLKSGGVYRWGETDKVDGSDRKKGMLGTGVGTNDETHEISLVCDGKKGEKKRGSQKTVDPAGICVFYGEESQWQDIVWLKQFRTAMASVDTVNNQTATLQRDIEKLQMLKHRAEEIYENTKAISEIKYSVRLTALPNVTAKGLTAYNAAQGYNSCYFILTWALLLL